MSMRPYNNNTFKQDDAPNYPSAVIGDEKQPDFHPQVKLQKWQNEANLSIGLDESPKGAKVTKKGDVITFEKGSKIARFYPTSGKLAPLTRIRRTLKGDEVTLIERGAEYEMFNRIGKPGEMTIAHFVVPEPSISVFDLMPASTHLEVSEKDGKVVVKDFNYPDKSKYHPADIPIPSYDRVALTRFYTQHTAVVNPYYMDEGLHNIDIHWTSSDLNSCFEELMQSVEEVFTSAGVEVSRQRNKDGQLPAKLYFKHGDRWVKFFSAQEEKEQILNAYINIKNAYNKAYDFYRPDVKKDVRDEYAYGVAFAYPNIDHSIVDQVIQNFAKRLKIPMQDKPYDEQEKVIWKQIQDLQNNYDWLADGKRKDAGYVHDNPQDGFEFEVDLIAKPASNEIKLTTNVPKNVVAYVQADIPLVDQAKNGDKRKPHVANSLAVYHAKKQDNNYQTGKVTHIYRPMAWDSSGYKVFCDFKDIRSYKDGAEYDISSGLTIVVPQDFLNNAQYPITIDPTFGYTTAGGSFAALTQTGAGIINILATRQTSGATLNQFGVSMSFYFSGINSGPPGPSSGGTQEAALYGSDGSFTYIAQTNNTTATVAAAWGTVNFSNGLQPLEASTDYLLAVQSSVPSIGNAYDPIYLYYDSTVGKTSYKQDTPSSPGYVQDSWPATLASASTQSSRQYSVYVTYGTRYPIMAGNSGALAVTAARALSFMATNDAAWAATATNVNSIAPVTTDIMVFKALLTTTPAASQSRTFTSVPSGITTTISNPDTTGTDATHMVNVPAGTLAYVNTTGTDTTSVAPTRWRLTQIGANQIFWSTSNGNLSTTLNRFMGVQDSGGVQTTAAAATQVAPESGTLQNLYVKMSGTIASGSYLVEIYTGTLGSETASGVKVTLDSSNQSAVDSTHTIAVTQGQGMYVQITPTTPATARAIAVGIEYVSGTAGNAVLLSSNNANVGTSGTTYNNWYGTGAWNATESNVQATSSNINVTGMYAKVSAAPTGATKSRTLTIRKDGANTASALTITDAATTGTWTGSLTVTSNSLINTVQTSANTPTNATLKYGIVYTYSGNVHQGDFLIMF